MTTFDLRRARLRSGEQLRETVELDLEPLILGGQEYVPQPAQVPGELVLTKASTGTVFELSFRASVHGPCFRCLRDTVVDTSVSGREYQATSPGGDPELMNEYLHDDVVDVDAWAHDALVLQLPDKILHAPDCAGLCPVCGKDLNEEPHTHEELGGDPRWAVLDELRGEL